MHWHKLIIINIVKYILHETSKTKLNTTSNWSMQIKILIVFSSSFFSSVVNVSNVRFVVFETRFRWKNRPSPPPPKAFQPTRLRSDLKSNSLNIPDPLCPSILCSWGLVKRLKWSWPLQISSGIFFSLFIQLSSHPASFFLKNAYSYPIFLKMIFQKKKKNLRRLVYL